MNKLRKDFGVKIGSSTGYTSEIMAKLKVGTQILVKIGYLSYPYPQPLAAAEGYVPDSYVTSDEVQSGRPGPAMIYLNMVRLDVYPAQVNK